MSLSSGWVFADSDFREAAEDFPIARIELTHGSVIHGDILDIHDGSRLGRYCIV